MKKNAILLSLGFVVLIYVGLVGFSIRPVATDLYHALLNNPFNDKDFDREIWLENTGNRDQNNPRGRMAYSLRDLLAKERPDRDEVIELLGEPDFGTPDSTRVSYLLGFWSGMRMDMDTFDVSFRDGRLESIALVQH